MRYSASKLKEILTKKFRDIFKQQCSLDIYNDNKKDASGNKLRTYRKFKSDLTLEPYLSFMKKQHVRQSFSRLRISAHNLLIETGRHHRPRPIPVKDRVCDLCDTNAVQDEFHIIMECDKFQEERHNLISKITEIFPDLANQPDNTKFVFIMQCQDSDLAFHVEKFLNGIINSRGHFWTHHTPYTLCTEPIVFQRYSV